MDNGGRSILLLGTLVFDIDPSIMPDWAIAPNLKH
jgi:hypothetical protein